MGGKLCVAAAFPPPVLPDRRRSSSASASQDEPVEGQIRSGAESPEFGAVGKLG